MNDSLYRLARGPALLACGGLTVATGVLVFAAFLASGDATWRRVVTVVCAVLAVVCLTQVLRFALRPPVVAQLGEEGFTIGRPRRRGSWKAVDDVVVADGVLRLEGDGARAELALELLDPAVRATVLREVYDRLNTAHGYRRFT